jgi:hypothetical protein
MKDMNDEFGGIRKEAVVIYLKTFPFHSITVTGENLKEPQ